MVIFHSYVKLPEGIYYLLGCIETRKVFILFQKRHAAWNEKQSSKDMLDPVHVDLFHMFHGFRAALFDPNHPRWEPSNIGGERCMEVDLVIWTPI